jgi:hypothetical protein
MADASLPVVESRGCLVAIRVWGSRWMLRFSPSDLQVVNVLRLLTRNDDGHGLCHLDRDGVDRYDGGRRIHIGRGRFDFEDGRSGLGDLDLRFGCASLRGELGGGIASLSGAVV